MRNTLAMVRDNGPGDTESKEPLVAGAAKARQAAVDVLMKADNYGGL